MQYELAKLLVDNSSYEEVKIREDYSGRAMYGRTTTGVIYGDQNDFISDVYALAPEIAEGIRNGTLKAEQSFRSDNMGLSIIIY